VHRQGRGFKVIRRRWVIERWRFTNTACSGRLAENIVHFARALHDSPPRNPAKDLVFPHRRAGPTADRVKIGSF
jgi:hypothetical protein